MESRGDTLGGIVCLELEPEFVACDPDDTGFAVDGLPRGSGGEVLHFDFDADGRFSRIEEREDGLPGGVFEEPDEPRGAEDSRHVLVGKIDGVFCFDHESHAAYGAHGGKGFHIVFGSEERAKESERLARTVVCLRPYVIRSVGVLEDNDFDKTKTRPLDRRRERVRPVPRA